MVARPVPTAPPVISEEPTMNLRIYQGKLQQQWKVVTMSNPAYTDNPMLSEEENLKRHKDRFVLSGTTEVWRDVPTISPAPGTEEIETLPTEPV